MTPIIFISEIVVTTKVTNDKTKVTAILPVTLADPGIKPNKLLIRIKRKRSSNRVNTLCVFFQYFV